MKITRSFLFSFAASGFFTRKWENIKENLLPTINNDSSYDESASVVCGDDDNLTGGRPLHEIL